MSAYYPIFTLDEWNILGVKLQDTPDRDVRKPRPTINHSGVLETAGRLMEFLKLADDRLTDAKALNYIYGRKFDAKLARCEGAIGMAMTALYDTPKDKLVHYTLSNAAYYAVAKLEDVIGYFLAKRFLGRLPEVDDRDKKDAEHFFARITALSDIIRI
jgi:hypothetical protein